MSVTGGLGGTTVKWSVAALSAPEMRRPERGDEVVTFACPRCAKLFSVRVESEAKARLKHRIYLVLGWALLLSLLVTVPMLFHLGGQTREESDQSTNPVGILFALSAVGFVAGLTFRSVGARYEGVKKFRLVRQDGTRTAWVQGHRMF
ncbi:hypothetical protein ACIGEZ_19600 [Streptomyces sp. NPDC085481]|uniref:hypothetical protein n=1 Tax=Streptomyces sp. NPDC085481 TaxID=3365727 RepID=UPI0037D7E724